MEKLVIPSPRQDRTYLAPLFLRVRCPQCGKIYRVDSRDIHSSRPHFECLVCLSIFAFDFPCATPLNVKARLLKASDAPLTEQGETRPQDVRACPKCSALNAKGVKECRSCGVLFERLEGLPLDPKLRALPSLVRAWQELMEDYENITKHLAFVSRCEELQAIPFALKKYKDLKEAQPQDRIAQEMVYRVLARRFARRAEKMKSNPVIAFLVRLNWARIGKMIPWTVSLMLIMIGLSRPELKNLAGIGTSILFVFVGLVLFFRGRLRLSDFW